MKQATRLALLLLCLCVSAAPVFAQSAEPIEPGDTIEARLDDEHALREYTFEAEAGDTVSITLMSDDFDPLVVLLDANGQELAYNDDGGPGSLNSRIGPYVLPDSGEYTIVANSYGNYFNSNGDVSATGAFTLMLEQASIRRIEYTQRVSGELTRTQSTAYFQFRGEAGDIINVVAEADAFRANLSLAQMNTDALGSALASGNDNSDQGVALIGGFVLPETGNYLIALMSSEGNVGAFSLEVDRQAVTPLAFDETIHVVFDAEAPLTYLSFEASAGEVISLTVAGDGTLDTTMALNGPDGYQIAHADDTVGSDPQIINQLLTQSGVYTVIVQPYSTGSTGKVTLRLEHGVLLSLDDGPQMIAMNGSHTRELLTFSASAGDRVRLTVALIDGSTLSPNVEITQGTQSIAYGSGSTVERLALDFTIPGDDVLFVRIDDYSYNEVRFEVRLETPGPVAMPETTEMMDAPTATPTPAEASAADVEDGLIEITEEPIIETTPEASADDGLIEITEEPIIETTPEAA